MARTPRRAKRAVRTVTPAAAFRNLTNSARKALDAGIEGARRLALDKAGEARAAALATAEEARSRTVEAVTHLEKVFEQRVSRAMSRLGVPTARDVRTLSRRVAELQASVERLKRARARA